MWILLACAALCLGVCLPLFFRYKPRKPYLAAAFKSLGTLCALVPALVAALRLDPQYWFFVLALLLHAAADYLLEFWFFFGVGAFLLGHLCYVVCLLKLFPLSAAHLVLLICFGAYLVWLFYRHRKAIGKQMLPFAVYALVLCLMASCGIAGGATSYSVKGVMIMLGAALFFFSDHTLFLSMLNTRRKHMDLLIMVTYYLAQLLLGGSCLF